MNITTESSYYRVAVKEGLEQGREEGKLEEAQRLVLRLGTTRFGEPGKAARKAIEAIHDLERLEQLGDRLFVAKSWSELLGKSRK